LVTRVAPILPLRLLGLGLLLLPRQPCSLSLRLLGQSGPALANSLVAHCHLRICRRADDARVLVSVQQLPRYAVSRPGVEGTARVRVRARFSLFRGLILWTHGQGCCAVLLNAFTASDLAASFARAGLTMSETWPLGSCTRHICGYLASGTTLATMRWRTIRSLPFQTASR
jgi:hypothetical protein